MTPGLEGSKLYDEILEPIIIVDMKSKKIVHCNEACKYLQLVKEDMVSSELIHVITSASDYLSIRSQVLQMEENCLVPNVSMKTFGEGSIRGDLLIGYVDHSREQLYMIFKYNKEEIREVFLKNRCYEAIYTLSFAYPFRLDVPNKTAYFIGPILEHFKVRPVMCNYPEEVLEAGVIHEEDREIFRRIVEKMYRGEETKEVFRTYAQNGEILWYKVEYIANQDVQGNVVEVIGEFINIQEKKELELKLHTDELTGCLNKATFQAFVKEKLEEVVSDHHYALFIIDIDNFKAINDNLGHQFGDAVLRAAGRRLQTIFRCDDYIGRIGGDEFMVFMHGVKDMAIIEEQARRIVESFDKTYKGNAREYRTTASIGISVYPRDGEEFSTLYNRADIALYDKKSRGKNGHTFYCSTMAEGNMNNTTPFDAASRALSQHFDQLAIKEIFSLLSGSKDYEASINKVLELLGMRFNAGRCYIFELNKEDASLYDNTYEWCAPGITSEIEHLQRVTQEAYYPLVELSNDEGIFYCNDLSIFEGQPTFEVMKEQGIQSFLLAFNKVDGYATSMVGFDDCASTRIWSSIEISTLMHASRIINQFLKYIQALEATHKAVSERLNVLDELYSYAYIIDDASGEILYYNQELKNTFPKIRKGAYCYEVLHNENQMCERCPIKKMKERGLDKYRCLLPMKNLNQTMLVSTSNIGMFEGRKATFFSCSCIEELDE